MTDSEKLDEILRLLRAGAASPVASGSASKERAGQIADDKLFSGQYGNPEAFTDPKEWTGPSMKGTRFADCPIDWLAAAAEMYDRFGESAEKTNKLGKNGKPCAWQDFQKSALCRRWIQEKSKSEPKNPREWDDARPLF